MRTEWPYLAHACDEREPESKMFPTHTHGLPKHGQMEMVCLRNREVPNRIVGFAIRTLYDYYVRNADEYDCFLSEGKATHYVHPEEDLEKTSFIVVLTIVDSEHDEVRRAYANPNGKFTLMKVIKEEDYDYGYRI